MKAYIGIKYYGDYRNKEIINKISSALERNGYGTSCIVRDIQNHQVKYNPQELMKLTFKEIDECDLVVIDLSEKDMEKASAIVVEQSGLTSHAAIVGLNFGKPTIVGAKDATRILKDGEIITVDSIAGLIYKGEAKVL